jgi:hypothetical protein
VEVLADGLVTLVVLAVVVYVWIIGPVGWFSGHKGRPLPDLW